MRNYKRKRLRNPDKRMEAAVRLRAQGLSNYKIGEELACSEGTVRNDLARWERERPNVTTLARKTDAQNPPPRGENYAPDYAAKPSNVVSLGERKAAG